MLLVGHPTSAAWVGDMIGEAGFRKAVRLERGVGLVVVYSVAPFAERLEKGPNMGGVSVRRRKSGEFWSSDPKMSTREGLLAPAF